MALDSRHIVLADMEPHTSGLHFNEVAAASFDVKDLTVGWLRKRADRTAANALSWDIDVSERAAGKSRRRFLCRATDIAHAKMWHTALCSIVGPQCATNPPAVCPPSPQCTVPTTL